MGNVVNISRDNIDEASAAELQKYMTDKGVKDLRLNKPSKEGWYLHAVLVNGAVIAGGPYPDMAACLHMLVMRLEEA